MGGTTALELAQIEPQVKATVVLSISGAASPKTPANLFLGVGLYEQLNPPQDLRQMWQNVCPDGVCDNFQEGTARKLVISPTTDHFTAPYDPNLIAQVINWSQRSLNIPTSEKPLFVSWFILGVIARFTACLEGGVGLVLFLAKSWEHQFKDSSYRTIRYGIAGLLTVTMAVSWALEMSNLLILALLLQLISNYALRHCRNITKVVAITALYGALGLGAFCLSGLWRGGNELWANPLALLKLPQFLLQWLIFILYNYGQAAKVVLLESYTLNLQPSWLFLALAALELIQPGLTLTLVQRVASWILRCLRRPLKVTGWGKISPQEVGLLGLLLLVFLVLLYQRLDDLDKIASQGMVALQLFGLLIVLPLGVGILVLRSHWFCRLEKKALLKRNELC